MCDYNMGSLYIFMEEMVSYGKLERGECREDQITGRAEFCHCVGAGTSRQLCHTFLNHSISLERPPLVAAYTFFPFYAVTLFNLEFEKKKSSLARRF